MNKTSSLWISLLFCMLFIVSCKTSAPQNETSGLASDQVADQKLVDSILQFGLDREALYTILGDLKPISTLNSFSFPLANADSTKTADANIVDIAKNRASLQRIERIEKVLKTIKIPDLRFVLLPYKGTQGSKTRNMQIYVMRESLVKKKLKEQEAFFAQFGFVPDTDPTVLLTANEFNDRYERFRGYGYLFGYPDHAVDFYVKASQHNDKTKEFVKRNFFQIPAHTRNDGYFVYAYPQDYTPKAEVDSVIYHRAVGILKEYRKVRENYVNKDGSLRALELIKNFKTNISK